jgi:hypothetical protein
MSGGARLTSAENDASDGAAGAQQRRLREALANQPRRPRSERQAYRHLPPARDRSCEQQIGDVGAPDEQDAADRRHQREERQSCAAGVRACKRRDSSAPAAIARRLFRFKRHRDCGELAADIGDGGGRRHARNDGVRACPPLRYRNHADRQTRPRIDAFRKRKARRHDPHDLTRQASLEHHLAADDIRRAAEHPLPETVADHELAECPRLRLFLFGSERASDDRADVQQREERRRHRGRLHDLNLVADRPHCFAVERHEIRSDGLEHAGSRAPVSERSNGNSLALDTLSGILLVQPDQPLGLLERKRLEQDRMDDREHRRVGPDSERQCEDRAGREPWRSSERAQGVPQIVEHGTFLPPKGGSYRV